MIRILSEIHNCFIYICIHHILSKYTKLNISHMSIKRPLILKPNQLQIYYGNNKFWNSNRSTKTDRPHLQNSDNIENDNSTTLEILSLNLDQLQENEVCYHDKTIREMEEQIDILKEKNRQQIRNNQQLLKELNQSGKQKRVLISLGKETEGQKQKFFNLLQKTHETVKCLQKEKLSMINKNSELQNKNEILKNKIDFLQENIEGLNKKLQFCHQQINFEKQLTADLEREVCMLKGQLQLYLSCIRDYEKMENAVNCTQQMNKQVNKKFLHMQQELKQARLKIQQQEKQEEKYLQEQNKLFLRIQELENTNTIMQEQLASIQQCLEYKNAQIMNFQANKRQYERRYVKIVSQMDTKIENLIFQLMALDKRNRQLVDQRDHYKQLIEDNHKYINEDSHKMINPQIIGSQQFMTILKQQNNEICNLRKKIDMKEEQIQRLKNKNEQQGVNWRQKNQQLAALLEIKGIQVKNSVRHYEIELETSRKQCDHLMKKNQELKSKQVAMKMEISDKDRIICDYVRSTKSKKQFTLPIYQ